MMKEPEELRKMFDSAGIKQDDLPIATYCNSGVSASYVFLALCVAGIKNARVYDSSWKEWGNDNSKPIE
jgi:thiosulfate/3-mercaptopyruvate sulfurtransferase